MFVTLCDHCGKPIDDNKSKTVSIRVSGYVDSADLCDTCLGKLIHIAESFLMGEEFEEIYPPR